MGRYYNVEKILEPPKAAEHEKLPIFNKKCPKAMIKSLFFSIAFKAAFKPQKSHAISLYKN